MNKFINNKKIILVIMMMISMIALSACSTSETTKEFSKGDLRVHFLDVGQADSALIQLPNGQVALIDGGNRDDSDFLVNYIKDLNIKKIDYIIATHPHEDHIGGLPEIVKTFDIGKIYMPNKTANTRIFESLLEEIKKKDLKITQAKKGTIILDEGDLKISTLAPIGEKYEKTNEYSVVNKLKYKDISLLFTGDAEKQSESEMINSEQDLSADILKVCHHGSNTSSTGKFLDLVKPKYAVISSEVGNKYGHPHKEVLDRLNQRNIKILRTDEMGTIILDSDGKSANLYSKGNEKAGDKKENAVINSENKNIDSSSNKSKAVEKTYIGNKNSKIYHDLSCNKLPTLENRIALNSKEEAESQGYSPHSVCIK